MPRTTHLPLLTALFATCLIVANIIAVKLVAIGPLILPAGVVIFPLSYLFGDVLTEVYGYPTARRVIWTGFFSNLVAVIAITLGGLAPAAPFWPFQSAYAVILGFAPRLLVASFAAYLVGEFANAYVLAHLKLATRGRFLWLRTIGSTLVGEGLDTCIFISIAFWGILPPALLLPTILSQWGVKVAYEVLATPFTYWLVGFLKRSERQDAYDHATRFNPFAKEKD